jgi:hypothetical protein
MALGAWSGRAIEAVQMGALPFRRVGDAKKHRYARARPPTHALHQHQRGACRPSGRVSDPLPQYPITFPPKLSASAVRLICVGA